MRKWILSAAGLALAAAVVGGVVAAQAQDAPPPQMQRRPGWEGMHRPDGWQGMGGGHGGWMHHRHPMMGLFYPSDDKALSGPDVQKIAEAFLLWQGNRTWKVTSVAENQDNTVSFAFAAADGTVIARFAVDRKTGHFHRLG